MKIRILYLITFCLTLLLGSCYVDEFGPPDLHYLCFADQSGTLHQTDLPVDPSSFVGIERLKDGRALIIGKTKLFLWNPYIGGMTDITPEAFIAAVEIPNVACSSDGEHIYYSSSGKIKRKNLRSNQEQTLVDSLGASFYGPVLSKDERYLTFMKSGKDGAGYLTFKGYPLFLNLVSNEVMSLKGTGSATTTAFVDSFRERIYYVAEGSLYTMEMDGSHPALVMSGFGNALLSGDGNFLVNSLQNTGNWSSYTQFYRDNRTMGWRFFGVIGQNSLARNVNLLYYCKLNRLYALNLNDGTASNILPSVIFGRDVLALLGIAPAWDGKDLVCVVRLPGDE